ncbi:MAG: zinc ribbon domain-containing protein [Actinobacteria bacterium]|nr:zinc ribbon domain-containing protein [Actinomycetota bacterium]
MDNRKVELMGRRLKQVRCEKCGTENLEESDYCKECGSPLGEGVPPPGEEKALEPSPLARFLTVTWSRRGPILIAVFVVLMMSMVFAPWAFIRLDVLGLSLVSRDYSGWEIIIPRILFFLSIIPLLVALMLIAGIGTRRRVVETHICTFFGGMMFTVWVIIFSLSQVIRSLVKNVHVLQVNVTGGQIATILLLLGFLFGIVVTSYDRGRLLAAEKEGS